MFNGQQLILSYTPGAKRMAPDNLFKRWSRHLHIYIYMLGKKHFPNIPETANVPEDGATLHVRNAHNCAVYPILS
jgi:hypothetical protein